MLTLMSLREVGALAGAEAPTPAASLSSAPDAPVLAKCLRQRQVRLARATIVAWLCANAVALVMVMADVFENVTPSSYLFWLVLTASPFLINLQ
jgi:hypothetical protein